MPLISELQQMYPGFKYQVAPIILGALGTVPNRLKEELLKVNIAEDQVRNVIKKTPKNGNHRIHQNNKNIHENVN